MDDFLGGGWPTTSTSPKNIKPSRPERPPAIKPSPSPTRDHQVSLDLTCFVVKIKAGSNSNFGHMKFFHN